MRIRVPSPLKSHPPSARLQANRFAIRKAGKQVRGGAGGEGAEMGTDYVSKLLHLAWHPEANVIAAAASNSLYMYCA
jgi:serine/threonine-protein phosphatase 2A regulatory subunit B